MSSKSTNFGIPPHLRTNFRPSRTFDTFDNVTAAIRFKSSDSSDKICTSGGIPSKSTIDLRISAFSDTSAKICNAPKRHFASLLSSKLTKTSRPPISWIA